MGVKLPDKENPFGARTPFDILGVDRSADARSLRRAMQEKIEDVRSQALDDDTRIRKQDEINWAYEQLRNPRNRAVLDVFSFDPRVGDNECKRRAERLRSVDFDYDRVFKGYDDLLPSGPEIDGSRLQTRQTTLETSVKLRRSETHDATDPHAEFKASMRFETRIRWIMSPSCGRNGISAHEAAEDSERLPRCGNRHECVYLSL